MISIGIQHFSTVNKPELTQPHGYVCSLPHTHTDNSLQHVRALSLNPLNPNCQTFHSMTTEQLRRCPQTPSLKRLGSDTWLQKGLWPCQRLFKRQTGISVRILLRGMQKPVESRPVAAAKAGLRKRHHPIEICSLWPHMMNPHSEPMVIKIRGKYKQCCCYMRR